jgi:hypothetical protein
MWCGREDSNFHGVTPTAPSTLRVYQFRHDRKTMVPMVSASTLLHISKAVQAIKHRRRPIVGQDGVE